MAQKSEHMGNCGKKSGFFSGMFDTEVDIKVRAFTVVALAGAVGNSLGFLANLFLYGFNFVTGFCFFCALLIISNLFFGLRSKYSILFGSLMLIMLDVLEFPLLTLTYGAVMYPYMIIGFHAVVMVTRKRTRTILLSLLGVYDIAIIIYSHLHPYIFGPQDQMGLLGSAVITFAISIAAVTGLILMWQNVYVTQTIETDPVTKVLSRPGFEKAARKVLEADPAGAYVLLYFNVVSFKTINSIFGNEGGNRFLQAVAQRITNAPFSPRPVGRINADRFVCLIKKEKFSRECLQEICNMPYTDKGRETAVLLNCGVYEIEDRTIDVSSMCDRACAALRFVHSSGSKYYAEYDEQVQAGYLKETEVFGEIDKAIRNREFVPYYQPIVDCANEKIVSAEALARWKHPEKGMIFPSVFIPVLEKKDMISNLDRIIAGHVHDFLVKSLAEGRKTVPVSVNLSRMDIYDHALMDELNAMLRESAQGRALHRFEITESAYEDMSAHALNAISGLRKNGATILVDDFGSGFSSLGMITEYEFDIIKLDAPFAAKIMENDRARGVVRSLIEMSHNLGAKVVAEGVETKEQFMAIKECGCDYAQGYYFYKPLPEDAFLELLNVQ